MRAVRRPNKRVTARLRALRDATTISRDDVKLLAYDLMPLRYHQSRNPLLAWHAFALCRRAGLAPPGWALGYLERVAANLLALTDNPPSDPPPAIAEALEMNSLGAGSVFSRYRDAPGSPLAWAALKLITHEGYKPSEAFEMVTSDYNARTRTSKQQHVNKTTVQRHFKKAFPDLGNLRDLRRQLGASTR